MTLEFIVAWMGFLMATYSVMGNDAPAQVLGTLLASHTKYRGYLWAGCAVLLLAALTTSWVHYDGDISFGRLDRIPPVKMEWFYLLAPIGLLTLTRFGVPVSTSFMMLAMFSSGIVLEKIMVKSMIGYGLAFLTGLVIWVVVTRIGLWQSSEANQKFWRPIQYVTTGTLWWFWMSHDLANVAVFLPRHLSLIEFIVVCTVMVAALGLIFRESGGKVHSFIFRNEKNTLDIRTACLIDGIYAVLLFYFKEMNNIPMSTTWVFVGLMGGRELGMAIRNKAMPEAIKVVGSRFAVLVGGASFSLALVAVVLMLK